MVDIVYRARVEGLDQIRELDRATLRIRRRAGQLDDAFRPLEQRFSRVTRQSDALARSVNSIRTRNVTVLARQTQQVERNARNANREFTRLNQTAARFRSNVTVRGGQQTVAGVGGDGVGVGGVAAGVAAGSALDRRILQRTSVAARDIQRELNAGAADLTTAFDRAEAGLARTGTTLRSVVIGASLATGGVVVLARGLGEVADRADRLTNLENALVAAGVAARNATDQVSSLAIATRTGLDQTGELVARVAQAGQDLDISFRSSLRLAQVVNQTFRLSGASQAAAAGATIQFIQGLQTGIIRGEEFNSIFEASPVLIRAIAAGLGVPVSRMRELAMAGRLTVDSVLPAILSQADQINSRFGQLTPTFSDAFTVLNTGATTFFGVLGQAADRALDITGQIQRWGAILNVAGIDIRDRLTETAEELRQQLDQLTQERTRLQQLDTGAEGLRDARVRGLEVQIRDLQRRLDALDQTIGAEAATAIGRGAPTPGTGAGAGRPATAEDIADLNRQNLGQLVARLQEQQDRVARVFADVPNQLSTQFERIAGETLDANRLLAAEGAGGVAAFDPDAISGAVLQALRQDARGRETPAPVEELEGRNLQQERLILALDRVVLGVSTLTDGLFAGVQAIAQGANANEIGQAVRDGIAQSAINSGLALLEAQVAQWIITGLGLQTAESLNTTAIVANTTALGALTSALLASTATDAATAVAHRGGIIPGPPGIEVPTRLLAGEYVFNPRDPASRSLGARNFYFDAVIVGDVTRQTEQAARNIGEDLFAQNEEYARIYGD